MNICVQGEVKIVFVFLSKRNIISFVPGKDLIPGRSLELKGHFKIALAGWGRAGEWLKG
jgi:hypothetical protein